MAVTLPGRHPAYKPIGRLRVSPFKAGKKNMMMPLNLTAMVDMFTVIVIFLLQSFSASGEIMFIQKDIKLPSGTQAAPLEERGPVVTLFHDRAVDDDQVLIEGETLATLKDLDDTENDIPALSERLTKIREREEKMVARDPTEPYQGHCIIQADKKIDFELVRKTIFSINQAGWTHIQFTVSQEGAAAAAAEGEGHAGAEG